MLNSMRVIIYCAFLLLSSIAAAEADPNKVTTFELGGATNSPGIVGKGELVIEEKLFHYDSNFTGSKSYNYNFADTKIRYGLIENRLEARLYTRGILVNDLEAGFTNTSLGTKIRLLDEHKYLPSTEVILDFEIPLGNKDIRNPGFDHSYMLVLGKQWIPKWGSIVNLSLDFASYESNSSDINSTVSIPYAFNINHSPNSKLNLFSHIFGSWSLTDGFPSPLGVDFGASYAINNDLVLVGWMSKGLNDSAPDMTVDFGFVYRPF